MSYVYIYSFSISPLLESVLWWMLCLYSPHIAVFSWAVFRLLDICPIFFALVIPCSSSPVQARAHYRVMIFVLLHAPMTQTAPFTDTTKCYWVLIQGSSIVFHQQSGSHVHFYQSARMRGNREVGEDVGWENQTLLYRIILILFLPTQTHPCTFLYFYYDFDYNERSHPQLGQPLTMISVQATDKTAAQDEYDLEANRPIIDTQTKMV